MTSVGVSVDRLSLSSASGCCADSGSLSNQLRFRLARRLSSLTLSIASCNPEPRVFLTGLLLEALRLLRLGLDLRNVGIRVFRLRTFYAP